MIRRANRKADVRIQAGLWKGRRLEVPESARPTSGRARLALFSVLGSRLAGARVLDLYAGSGAVGLESVSRGAAGAVLVETDASALGRTLARLGVPPPRVRLIAASTAAAVARLAREAERFDIIFADPPYEAAAPEGLAGAGELLAEGGILVLQRDEGQVAPELAGLRVLERRAYGRNVFLFFGML